MENKNHHTPRENVNPVSRKTNEEIDEGEDGKLIVGGEVSANRGLDSGNLANEKNDRNDSQIHLED